MEPEDTVRGSKQPFMSDEFGHRLVVDHGVFARHQEMHGGLAIQKVSKIKKRWRHRTDLSTSNDGSS
jgi:hypothetical protein